MSENSQNYDHIEPGKLLHNQEQLVNILGIINAESANQSPEWAKEWTRDWVMKILETPEKAPQTVVQETIEESQEAFQSKILDALSESPETADCLNAAKKLGRMLFKIGKEAGVAAASLDYAISRYDKAMTLAQREGDNEKVVLYAQSYAEMADRLIAGGLSCQNPVEGFKQGLESLCAENSVFIMEDVKNMVEKEELTPDEFTELKKVRKSTLRDRLGVKFKDKLTEQLTRYNQKNYTLESILDTDTTSEIAAIREIIAEHQRTELSSEHQIGLFNSREKDAQLNTQERELIVLLRKEKVLLQAKEEELNDEEFGRIVKLEKEIKKLESDFGIFDITDDCKEVKDTDITLQELQGSTPLSEQEKRQIISAYKLKNLQFKQRLIKDEEWKEDEGGSPEYQWLAEQIKNLETEYGITDVDDESNEVKTCTYQLGNEKRGRVAEAYNDILKTTIERPTSFSNTLLKHQRQLFQSAANYMEESTFDAKARKEVFIRNTKEEVATRISGCETVEETKELISLAEAHAVDELIKLTTDFGTDEESVKARIEEFKKDNPNFNLFNLVHQYRNYRKRVNAPADEPIESEESEVDRELGSVINDLLVSGDYDPKDNTQKQNWALLGRMVLDEPVDTTDDITDILTDIKHKLGDNTYRATLSPALAIQLESLIDSNWNTVGIRKHFGTLFKLKNEPIDVKNKDQLKECLTGILGDFATATVSKGNQESARSSLKGFVTGMMIDHFTTKYYVSSIKGTYVKSGSKIKVNQNPVNPEGATFLERTQDYVSKLQEAVKNNDSEEIIRIQSSLGRKLRTDVAVFPMDLFRKKKKYKQFVDEVRDSESDEALPEHLRAETQSERDELMEKDLDDFETDEDLNSLSRTCTESNGSLLENDEGLQNLLGTTPAEIREGQEAAIQLAQREAVGQGDKSIWDTPVGDIPGNIWGSAEKKIGRENLSRPRFDWKGTKDQAGRVGSWLAAPAVGAAGALASSWQFLNKTRNLPSGAGLWNGIKTVASAPFTLPFKGVRAGMGAVGSGLSAITDSDTYTRQRTPWRAVSAAGRMATAPIRIPASIAGKTIGAASGMFGNTLGAIPLFGDNLQGAWRSLEKIPGDVAEFAAETAGVAYWAAKDVAKMIVPGFKSDVIGDQLGHDWGNFDHWYNLFAVYKMITFAYENLKERATFYNDIQGYKLGQTIFKGVWDDLYTEFNNKYQSKENERVNQYKETIKDGGMTYNLDKLQDSRDQFELKAALEQAAEIGILYDSELLDQKTIKNMNQYLNIHIPEDYTFDEIQANPELKAFMKDQMKKAIDNMWGDNTFSKLEQQHSSGFKSKMDDAGRVWNLTSVNMKSDKLQKYFGFLQEKNGVSKLLKEFHKAEVIGDIIAEVKTGDVACWQYFGLFQAMICEGVINESEVRNLLLEVSDSAPTYTVTEPSMMSKRGIISEYQKYKHLGFKKENPFFAFFAGEGKLNLRVRFDVASNSWTEYSDDPSADDYYAGKPTMEVSARELQSMRQANLSKLYTSDNADSIISSSSGNYQQFRTQIQEDNSGTVKWAGKPSDTAQHIAGFGLDCAVNIMAAEDVAKRVGTLSGAARNAAMFDFYKQFQASYVAIAKMHGMINDLSVLSGKEMYDNDGLGAPGEDPRPSDSRNRTRIMNYRTFVTADRGKAKTVQDYLKKLNNSALSSSLSNMYGLNFITGNDPIKDMEWSPTRYFKPAMNALFKHFNDIARSNGLGNLDFSADGGVNIEKESQGNRNGAIEEGSMRRWLVARQQDLKGGK